MRKKFTLLFASLLAFVGVAKAGVTDLPQITTDLESPIYYTIYNTRSGEPGGLMYYAGDAVGLKDGCTSLTLEDKYQFFFTGSHDAMYIHNKATGNKLASVSSWTEAGVEWAMGVSPKGGGLAIGPKGGLGGNSCINEKNYANNETTSDFTTWSANDAGSIFVVELASSYVFPVSDLFYVIECPLFEKVQGEAGKKAIYVNGEGKAVWGAEDLTNHNSYWIPVAVDGKIALKNFGTGKYLSNTDGTMTDEPVAVTLNALGDNSFNIKLNATLHANGHGAGAGASGTLTNWDGVAGSASAWRFVQKNDPTALQEVTVKYSFTYDGVEKYTQETATLVGEEWPAITVAFPYSVSATKPAGEVSAEGAVEDVVTKEIELSVNLPFVSSADKASIENWYYLIFHANQKNYLYYTADDAVLEANKNAVDANDKDSYTWAFVGNPFDGFKVYNKKAGKFLDAAKDGAVVNAAEQVFKLTASDYGTNGFYMQAIGGDYTQRFNKDQGSGKVVYWSGADAGSTFMVELRDDAAALQALIAATETQLASWNQTGVGYVTASAEGKAAVSEAIATAKAAVENKTGYDAAEVALKDAVAAAKPYTIQPVEGKFYTIANAHTDGRGGQKMYVNADGGMQFSADAANNIFQFVSAGEGKFYLYNVENGVYLSTAKGHGGGQNQTLATSTAAAKAVTVTNMGKDNQVKIVPDGGAMLHAQTSGSAVVGWNSNNVDDASAWKISEVEFSLADLAHTLTVSETGWATLVLGYNTAIPAGVKAYAVSSLAEGKAEAVLSEVADVLPAHTPVLIKAEANDYTFEYTAAEATVESNLLKGSVFNENVVGDIYVLNSSESGVGLYKAVKNVSTDTTNDGTEEEPAVTYEAFLSKAFEAYLPFEGENVSDMFSLVLPTPTGIANVEVQESVVIYDLLGRRVEKMEKGLYIVNGRKVLVK